MQLMNGIPYIMALLMSVRFIPDHPFNVAAPIHL